jgi:beta-galactosidase
MVFIASHWTPGSSRDVRVFSNCDEVELRLNGTLLQRRSPDSDRLSTHIKHPPFTFQLKRFEPGVLEATGYLGDREAARHAVRTPGAPEHLELRLDESGRPFAAAGKDVAFLHADIKDADGTVVPDAWENVFFGAAGDVELVGANPFSSEAGIATILAQTETRQARGAVYALCLARDGERVHILSASLPFGEAPSDYEVRATTDGSDPEAGAVHRAGPAIGAERVRAAMIVEGRRVVEADTESPRFRIAGSTAP